MARKADSQVSIANVAAMAGVSTATVSRVLSGHRRKDDEISRRVHAAAEKLNYSANFAASALRSEQTRTIGLIMAGANDGLTGAILDLVSHCLTERGRYLMVISESDNRTWEAAIRSLTARQVEGILVIPSMDADPTDIPPDLRLQIPIVQIGGHPFSYHACWVGMDLAASMRMVITHLAEQNAQSVAFLSRDLSTSGATDLFTTFYSLTSTLDMAPEPEWVQFGPCSMQRGHDAAKDILTTGRTHPDAIVCGDDQLALGALMACQELGIDVPDQVKVVSFTDSPTCQVCKPTLTTVRPPLEGIVQEALRLIETNNQTLLPAHIALAPELDCRESTWSPRTGSSDMTEPGTFPY